MDNKLSELSKPVGFVSKQAQALLKSGDTASIRPFFDVQGSSPLYSQEYVSALLTRIEELEKKETWRERQSVIDGLARSGEAWADIEEYMEKWDAEHRKTMMERSNG
ncbi:hypothetical protein SMQC20_04570 [Serratia marcescens]|nr:hypothetical protein SMQC20_04570 [Serratia marcescens]